MIPFLCRHVCGLPATVRNLRLVRARLAAFRQRLAEWIGGAFLALCLWQITKLVFSL